MNGKQVVLLFVAGGTPAVITETMYALFARNPSVTGGRIEVITTTFGRDSMKPLLDSNEADGPITEFNQMYGTHWAFSTEQISVLSKEIMQDTVGVKRAIVTEIDDIRTPQDNEVAANSILKRVRALTNDDETILIASLAGGRKTMGTYLYQAMSWFAREHDELSHVLVRDQALELDKSFFFPKKDEVESEGLIDYANLPFVRMRRVVAQSRDFELVGVGSDYSEVVRQSQALLKGLVRLDVHWQKGWTGIESSNYGAVHLPPLPTALLAFLLKFANRASGQSPFFFRNAITFRDALGEMIAAVYESDASDESKKRLSGLSALALGAVAGDWPKHWLPEAIHSGDKKRQDDLNQAFGKLNKGLKAGGYPPRALIHHTPARSVENGPGRFVDIDPSTVKFCGSDPVD